MSKRSLIDEMVLQVLHHSECAETLHAYKYEKKVSARLYEVGTTSWKNKNLVLTEYGKEFIIADSELLVLGVLQFDQNHEIGLIFKLF